MEKLKHVNLKNNLLTCAFCTHWYDPANSHIKPVDPFVGMWDCDVGVKSYCEVRQKETFSESNCARFERKLPKP